MINCNIVGRLTADPVVATRHIGDNDVKVANFTIAANTGFGERRKTVYFRCALWRGQAEFAEKYLMKGRLVSARGSIGMRSYIGNNGSPQTILEFGNDVQIEVETANPANAAEAPAPADDPDVVTVDEEDLPF